MDEPRGTRHTQATAFKGRIFSVTSDRVTLPNGRTVTLEIVRHPGSVVLLKRLAPAYPIAVISGSPRIDAVLRVALTERGQRLASYQRLAGYAISREALPRTRLGKYPRYKLPALYAALRTGGRPAVAGPLSEDDRALLAASPGSELWAWLKTRYRDRDLHLDLSPQLDLGIDSLEWITMTLELAERFDVHFTEEDGGEMRDAEAAVAHPGPAACGAGPDGEQAGHHEQHEQEVDDQDRIGLLANHVEARSVRRGHQVDRRLVFQVGLSPAKTPVQHEFVGRQRTVAVLARVAVSPENVPPAECHRRGRQFVVTS
jgi:acyl carrier protein